MFIMSTLACQHVTQHNNISFSRGKSISIPEICGKCGPFNPFLGSSAKYLGRKERKGMKEVGDEQTERELQCQAELCGRENWLKALGSVAIYLADRSAIRTNDNNEGSASYRYR